MHVSEEVTKVEAQSQLDDSSGEPLQNDVVSSNSQHIPDDQPRRALGFRARLYQWLHDGKSRDQVEHDFWSMIQEGAPDPTIQFLQDYGVIKSYRGRAIFNHNLWYTEYQKYVEEHPFHSEFRVGDLTFSDALCKLGEQLRSVPTRPTMKLWFVFQFLYYVLSSGILTVDMKRIVHKFTKPHMLRDVHKLIKKHALRDVRLSSKMFATPNRLKRMYQVPINAVLHVIRKEWGPDHPCLPRPGVVTEPLLNIVERQLRIPSKVSQQKAFSIDKGGHMAFTWVVKAPKYQNYFYEYVWQRQTEYPGCEKAIVSGCRNANGSLNVMIMFDSTSDTQLGRESSRLFEEYYNQHKDHLRLSLNAVDNPPSVETEFIASIYAIYACLSTDTVSFLDAVSCRLSHLTFLGRQKPPGAKLHYLSHLDDCRRISALGIDEALLTLSQIENAIKENSMVDRCLLEKSKTIKADLLYLSAELANLKARIEELHKMLRDKLEINQISRTYILTILAAIYLPFSFMTSLFGMNLIDPLSNSTPNVIVPSSSNDSSPFSQNQTASIVNAITTSGTHLWSFKSYWYITIPLTIATIFLPLVAGAIFRTVSRFLYRYRTSWRLITTIFAIVLAAILFVVAELQSELTWEAFDIVTSICLGIPALYGLGRAILRKQNRLIWSVFLSLVILSSVPLPSMWSHIFTALALAYLPAVLIAITIYRAHRHNRVKNQIEMSQRRTEGDAERGNVDGCMRRDSGES